METRSRTLSAPSGPTWLSRAARWGVLVIASLQYLGAALTAPGTRAAPSQAPAVYHL